jgi:ornithine carbamoyltransferase
MHPPVRHLRSLLDLSPTETRRVVELARACKIEPRSIAGALAGKSIALIFAKQSTRTRISFEVGVHQLGAHPLVLGTGGATGMQMGRGETIHDTAKVLSRYVDAIVIRTFDQREVEELAAHGSIPVVNALTDRFHPCQALADLQTIAERFGSCEGRTLTWVGAGNNVAHSLALAGPRAGMHVVLCCPPSLQPDPEVWARAQADAREAGTRLERIDRPREAVRGADVIYTDTWVSMGEESQAERLRAELAGFTVDAALLEHAAPDAIFMHCLPAHRGEEVTDEVMDGPRSVVFDQAENRLHAQKALLALLLGARPWS